MRILMIVIRQGQQISRGFQYFENRLICGASTRFFQHRYPDQLLGNLPIVNIATIVIERTVCFQAICLSGKVIVQPMTGSRMNATRARLHGHVFGGQNRTFPVDKRMTGHPSFHFLSDERLAPCHSLQRTRGTKGFNQAFRNPVVALLAFNSTTSRVDGGQWQDWQEESRAWWSR